MNLTKKMREELAAAVIKDQFKADIENAISSLSSIVNEDAKDLVGKSRKARDLISEVSKEACVSGTQAFFIKSPPSVFGVIFGVERITVNHNWIVGYSKAYHFCTEPKITHLQSQHIDNATKELFAIIGNAQSVYDDLLSVLYSVKTVEKLNELTHVFKPFIKEQTAKSTSLIAVEQLLRINELKSPKE